MKILMNCLVKGMPVEIVHHATGPKTYINSGYYLLGALVFFYFWVVRFILKLFEPPEPGPFEDTGLGATTATRDHLRRAGLLKRRIR
jgi:hypothetical protein